MKKILVIIASLLVINTQAQFTQATLQASGLTCAMCSKAIYTALEKLPFAEGVKSNIKESSFTINLKQGVPVDFDAIRKAVENAGFAVANLKVKANFKDVSINNDSHVAMNGKTLHFLGVKQQVLNGEQLLQVVDKKFVTDKVYNKYASTTKMECVKSGLMQNCCAKDGVANGTRIYHVTI